MVKLERIYTVPLGDAYSAVRNNRVPKAVDILRTFASRHMKAKGERVVVSEALNMFLWQRSIMKPPRRVKVRLVKDDGEVRAYLADEKIVEKKKEEKAGEKKEAKKEEKKAEEKKPEAKKEERKAPEKTEARHEHHEHHEHKKEIR